MRSPLALLAAAILAAGCVHRKPAPPAETAVPVHGKIVTEPAENFGVSPAPRDRPAGGRCSSGDCEGNAAGCR
jgi:hypothetical protein